tara:strand:- start:322 stop:528 length:207 start_codon:yes stop_codon:yes gene_type:complete
MLIMNNIDKKIQKISDDLLKFGINEDQISLSLETSKFLREILSSEKIDNNIEQFNEIYSSISTKQNPC